MKITWEKCESYKKAKDHAGKAKDHSGVIYLHEWSGQSFYWGKVGVDSSFLAPCSLQRTRGTEQCK